MIKKLNNKGISTAEVLVCFVLIVLVSSSIYSIVSTSKNKQQVESFKEKVVTYKNLLTKEINNDLIKKGLIAASYNGSDTVTMNLKNGETKCLKINSRIHIPNFLSDPNYQGSVSCPMGTCSSEVFRVGYGDCGNEVYYPLPDLGSSFNVENEEILDLRIANISVSTASQVLSINIRFYHPELGYKYGIDIVNPIDFSL